MFCKICGKMIAENAMFCTFCGTPVNENQQSQSSQESVSETPYTATTQTTTTQTPATPEQAVSVPMQSTSSVTENPAFEYSLEPPAPQPKEVKYYTLGHIILCLTAAGIMALLAGIFAGLYFSAL